MYAAIMYLTIDPVRAPIAAAAFSSELLPRVRAASGFVSGHWVDPLEGEGLGFMVFDTEAQAIAATSTTAWDAPGVQIKRVDVRRIAVSVP